MNKAKQVVIFVGPPGSGKGTLSRLCIEQLGWIQLSTGNLCRKHIAEQTSLGKLVDQAIKQGKLVDDQLIVTMVHDWMLEQKVIGQTIILDGYPRTLYQAQALVQFAEQSLSGVSLRVIRLVLDNERIVERITGRAICQNKDCQAVYSVIPGSLLNPRVDMVCDVCQTPLMRRVDDHPETVRDRLETYYRHEQELLSYYEQRGVGFVPFLVDRAVGQLFEDFKKTMVGQQ